jgi:glucosamine--fructose-6-phosphate aminotransferase (isomerizing)
VRVCIMAERTVRKNGRGKHTLREIRSQADSWESALAAVKKQESRLREICEKAEEIVFAGCGSAYNVSHAVAPFFQSLSGKTSRAVHSSDFVINPALFLNRTAKTLAVIVSRSGDTTESVLALRTARSLGCTTLAVTCFRRSAMAKEADAVLLLDGAVEKSVTTTRSLTSMVLAGYALTALNETSEAEQGQALAKYLAKLPALCRSGMERFEELGRRVSEDRDIRAYAFLGTGSMYGLAREAQLKIKEMVLLPSDSYVSLDYQHGPMSNVDGGMLVTMLTSAPARSYEREVARNMKALGGKVFVLCGGGSGEFAEAADYLLDLTTLEGDRKEPLLPARGHRKQRGRSAASHAASAGEAAAGDVTDAAVGILYMPALQFTAYYTSLAVGCDPDKPKNLSYYVKVKGPSRG